MAGMDDGYDASTQQCAKCRTQRTRTSRLACSVSKKRAKYCAADADARLEACIGETRGVERVRKGERDCFHGAESHIIGQQNGRKETLET